MAAQGKAKKGTRRKPTDGEHVIERVQTGVRIETRLLRVLKALVEYHEIDVGDLLEGIALHAFDGECPFGKDSLSRIANLKCIHHLDLDSSASHRLRGAGETGHGG